MNVLFRRICCLTAAGAFLSVLSGLVADDAIVSGQKPAETAAGKVELKEGTWKDVEKLVADHAKKIVVVDVWSTSCAPCMTEFPHLIALQKQFGEKIICVSVNVDYLGIKSRPPSYYRPRVEKFLKSRKSTIRNFLCTTETDVFFDERKLGSIPAVYVYGKDGKLAKRFDSSLFKPGDEESFTYERDINPFVADLLAK